MPIGMFAIIMSILFFVWASKSMIYGFLVKKYGFAMDRTFASFLLPVNMSIIGRKSMIPSYLIAFCEIGDVLKVAEIDNRRLGVLKAFDLPISSLSKIEITKNACIIHVSGLSQMLSPELQQANKNLLSEHTNPDSFKVTQILSRNQFDFESVIPILKDIATRRNITISDTRT